MGAWPDRARVDRGGACFRRGPDVRPRRWRAAAVVLGLAAAAGLVPSRRGGRDVHLRRIRRVRADPVDAVGPPDQRPPPLDGRAAPGPRPLALAGCFSGEAEAAVHSVLERPPGFAVAHDFENLL